jgi:hypothetical protein
MSTKLDWAKAAAKQRVAREAHDWIDEQALEAGPPCGRCQHVRALHADAPLEGKVGCHADIWIRRREHTCPCPAFVAVAP